MERKAFLQKSIGLFGLALATPSLLRAGSSDLDTCSVTNSETAGPFPTINPSSLVTANIVGDRTGVAFTINITIKNTNGNCAAYQGAIVDIWHCDRQGNYSEYGGSGMQPTNYTNYHFHRGRQTTNANGLVSFTSIFPSWYTGRATHIHVHIYNASGTSLLVTQIAFPEGTGSAVNTVNAATSYGYTKGMTGYTYNSNDNVFSDGVSNEMASSVTGSLAGGYTLTHEIFVAGPTLGIEDISKKQYSVGQNYPNPFSDTTTIPVSLNDSSKITIQIYDLVGRLIATPVKRKEYSVGTNEITLNRSSLNVASGYYLYNVTIENDNGSFTESKKMLIR